jgi:toxin CptA
MTPSSTRSSSACASFRRADPRCRLEWRPSRWLQAVLAALAGLAAFALLASEAPRPLAWPAALAALVHGAVLVRRERARPSFELVLRGGDGPVLVDGAPVADFRLQWRGPLAFAAWKQGDGRRRHATWWPDTLPPARRRELRLAAPPVPAARRHASMAP